jgi:hypothetical protein
METQKLLQQRRDNQRITRTPAKKALALAVRGSMASI